MIVTQIQYLAGWKSPRWSGHVTYGSGRRAELRAYTYGLRLALFRMRLASKRMVGV